MQISKEKLSEYARLIVRTGANVQPGQVVQLSIAVEQHAFAAMITEEAYLAGAKKVNLNWLSDGQNRLHYRYAEEAVLSETLPWEKEKLRQMTEDLPVRIFIESEDPDALAGLDPEKLSRVMQSRAAVAKPYRDEIDGRHQWCIAALPSEAWARKCFPGRPDEEAMELLYDAVFRTVRISDHEDAVDAWHAHTERIEKKSTWLNAQGFTSLRYESSNGTDFTVALIPEAHWEGAGSTNCENGVYYIPNMPTEEIFTSPMAGKCEGTLVAVKPLSWNGQLIEDFSITFSAGKAVSCKAAKGQELLNKMLHMDEGACMLGEVALVPKESPVNQCGFLFYSTLFDENACCHFAVGQGFKEVLPDGDRLTTEEAAAAGINDSIIHVDFMVGADDLSITGYRPDGSSAAIFRNGTWAE
jgi:aminopeptidase